MILLRAVEWRCKQFQRISIVLRWVLREFCESLAIQIIANTSTSISKNVRHSVLWTALPSAHHRQLVYPNNLSILYSELSWESMGEIDVSFPTSYPGLFIVRCPNKSLTTYKRCFISLSLKLKSKQLSNNFPKLGRAKVKYSMYSDLKPFLLRHVFFIYFKDLSKFKTVSELVLLVRSPTTWFQFLAVVWVPIKSQQTSGT